MARPMPTSAAATVITNSAKTWPVTRASFSHCENATRFTFTAFSISSIDISTSTAFRRASTPYTPVAKSTAENARTNGSRMVASPSGCIGLLPPGQGHGADQRGQQQDGHDLERHDERVEDRRPHLGRGRVHGVDAVAGE